MGMTVRRRWFISGLLAALCGFALFAGPTLAVQGSYDTLRIDNGGVNAPYAVWVEWSPEIVAAPDGGAWAFFSAQAGNPDGSAGTKKLYSSHFDPATGVWTAATPLPGGQIQFGASAVVDAQGVVHVVFTDRADDQPASFGTLTYVTNTPEGGWSAPVQVAPDPAAGHQLSPELVIDKNGALHCVWQDQRAVDQASRDAAASNADIFSSDLGADGTWTAPVQLSARPDATTNASRPQLATDGDRLVAVWSIYDAANGLATAARLEWSVRPIDGSSGWSPPQVLMDRGDSQIGGRLLDLASDPTGGAQLVVGRLQQDGYVLSAQKLAAGATSWSAPTVIGTGNRGSFPTAAVGPDGTLLVAYNTGSGTSVQVGVTAFQQGQPRGSVETVVTAAEDGAQGRANITIDGNGRTWLIYMHEPTGQPANEIRVARAASIALDLAPEAPVGTPAAGATPAG